MTDQELLEKAARALGATRTASELSGFYVHAPCEQGRDQEWLRFDPINSGIEAFNLMVKLDIDVYFYPGIEEVIATAAQNEDNSCHESIFPDKAAATRRSHGRPMTLHIIYGNARDEMTKTTQPYATLKAAESAYFALEFNRWCALMDGDTVIRTNINTGPVVSPRIKRGDETQ